MQCASCQFENMPGVPVCGRCGARLELAAATIDVHPPRARPGVKRFRRWFPWYALARRSWDGLRSTARALVPDLTLPRLRPAVLVRLLVPGWPQRFNGQTTRARAFLSAYLCLLAIGILLIGTQLGSIALGLAMAVHASSVIDVVWTATTDVRARAICAAVCLVMLGAIEYVPVVWTVTRFAVPRVMALDAPPFAAGDGFLYNPSAYRGAEPSPGEVVLFRVVPNQVPAQTPQGYYGQYRVEGEFVDRVLAGPGQNVKWDGKSLAVNGRPSTWLPLNPAKVAVSLQCTVPEGRYLVIPSAQPLGAPSYPPEVWLAMSLVPRENVLGRVFLRHHPVTRWWWVR